VPQIRSIAAEIGRPGRGVDGHAGAGHSHRRPRDETRAEPR
jgi:hypothetical protein